MTNTTAAIVDVSELAVKVRAQLVAALTDAPTEAAFEAVSQFAAFTSEAWRAPHDVAVRLTEALVTDTTAS